MSLALSSWRLSVRRLLAAAISVYGYLSVFTLSFTSFRFILVLVLLPLYLLKLLLEVLPTILSNATSLLSPDGWDKLITDTDTYRDLTQQTAKQQLDGSYEFKEADLHPLTRGGNGWMAHVQWGDETHEFTVCGATARFIHFRPVQGICSGGNGILSRQPFVFLHGNPSWSFMWRNIISPLVDQGHEVYALDWLGHGRSDKIACPELINFELHMRTLTNFFKVSKLKDAIVVAHDWGGCIALCTLPSLPRVSWSGLFLLNTFLPPRVSDMSLHCGLLYAIWFLTGGILGRYIPESLVMSYMSPKLSLGDIEAYGAPYRGMPISAKSSVYRFGHIVPGTPRIVLRDLRDTRVWKVFEGACGPKNFDNLDAQSRLSLLGDRAREFWGHVGTKGHYKLAVVFGDRDPLLIDYKDVLVETIDSRVMVNWAVHGVWLHGGGHYPVEEKAERILGLLSRFFQDKRR